MNPVIMYAAGLWGAMAIASFSDREAFAGAFKLGVSIALVVGAALVK